MLLKEVKLSVELSGGGVAGPGEELGVGTWAGLGTSIIPKG